MLIIRPRTLFPAAALCTFAAIGCAAAQPPATPDIDVRPERSSEGTIVEGEGNPVGFTPEATAVEVDAESVDLAQVLDDLGPIAQRWYRHVQTLADPFFEGRVPETRGGQLAAEYVEYYLQDAGLEPAFPAGDENVVATDAEKWISYRQPFTYNMLGSRMRTQVRNEQMSVGGDELEEGEDYVVLGISGSGHVTAPVTFVGYGIAEGEDGYSSFEDDTDLTGRIAMVLRYEPLDADGNSRWGDRGFSRHAVIARKFRALRARGAAGIILVNPPDVMGGAHGLESIGRSSRFGGAMPVPTVQVTPEIAEQIISAGDAHTRTLLDMRMLADTNEVTTVDLDDELRITMSCDVSRGGARQGVLAENVGAILPGKGELADQWLIIGAHYDHVGYGEFGTSPQYRGELHPGADDNASGTAGLLVLASSLAEAYDRAEDDAQLRSVLFLAFDAEESGLHGSREYANNATVDLDRVTAMLNMDMIGRVRNNQVVILGSATAEGLERVLEPHIRRSGLTASLYPSGSGRSDDANFINNEVPAMHFFSGMHDDYHAPMDEAHTVNPAGARDVLMLVHDIAMDLASREAQLTFSTPQRTATRDRGYGNVRLGIRPSMEEVERGIPVQEVSLDTSADDAGIKAGDVLLAWNDDELNGLGDLATKLRDHAPGDVVRITLLRDGEEQQVEVTLKSGN